MIVLASTSPARRGLLSNAGIAFEAVSPPVDERRIEPLLVAGGASLADLAVALADAKALATLPMRPDDLVIGSDQVLDLDGAHLVKPVDREDAASQIRRLAGRTHRLHTAVTIAGGDAVIWRHLSTVALTMRPLDEASIRRYLDAAGDDILRSVGGYLLEGVGIQLFSAIEGDYFSILGLPLLPLLGALRDLGAIES